MPRDPGRDRPGEIKSFIETVLAVFRSGDDDVDSDSGRFAASIIQTCLEDVGAHYKRWVAEGAPSTDRPFRDFSSTL